MTGRVVRGVIRLPGAGLPERAGQVVVQVEDISRADAPSIVLAEQRLRDVELIPGGAITFSLDVPGERVDPRALYSVRAHVDVAGDGTIEPGDLLTVQTFPVLTRGHGDEVTLQVRKI